MTKPLMTKPLVTRTPTTQLWDIAGADGLEVAEQLFGKSVGYLSPFQSVETVLKNEACSVLRLCDRNFRIRYGAPLDQLVTPLNRCVWVKRYPWLTSLTISTKQLLVLTEHLTVRAPHRLAHFPNHQALPACLETIPLLIWRHLIEGKPGIELQVAQKDLRRLKQRLDSFNFVV